MVLYTSATNMSVILSRAYFKESLQLQRMEKFQTSKHFKISCQKKVSFPKISDILFLVIYKKISISSTKNVDDLFLVISSISYGSALPNAAGTIGYNSTAQTNYLHLSFSKCHAFQHSFIRFSTVPVQNLQLQVHNSHFTTANYILQLHKL